MKPMRDLRPGRAARLMVIALMGTFLLTPRPAMAQAMRLNGWWVVLTSIRDDGSMAPHNQMRAFSSQMRACRIDVFSDLTTKFQGFAPGYLVGVVGAFPTEAEAQQQLANARRCAPGAYIKRARHLGE